MARVKKIVDAAVIVVHCCAPFEFLDNEHRMSQLVCLLILAWAVIKDWTFVESERSINTPSKISVPSTGNATPRKRIRRQSESPTPTSSRQPETLNKLITKDVPDGDVFKAISFFIRSLTLASY